MLTADSEAPRNLPEVEKACSLIVSAAGQLICTVRPPVQTVLFTAFQASMWSNVRTASLTY